MRKRTLWNMDCRLPTLLTQFAYLGIHLSSLYSQFAILLLRFTAYYNGLYYINISISISIMVAWLWGLKSMLWNLRKSRYFLIKNMNYASVAKLRVYVYWCKFDFFLSFYFLSYGRIIAIISSSINLLVVGCLEINFGCFIALNLQLNI